MHSVILIWATDLSLADELASELADANREVRVLESDAELAASSAGSALLVAEAGPRLEAQRAFLRGPIILLDAERAASRDLVDRAYAVVDSPPEASLAVDRFLTHRQAAEQVAGARGSPRRCARCGRGFDALKARRGGTARRFVRFGSIALCGSCVEKLRSLLRQADRSVVVEADA